MAKKGKVKYETLWCSVCGKLKNYLKTINTQENDVKTMKTKKFCPTCRKHTVHTFKEHKS